MVVELHCEATLPLRTCQTGQVVWRLPHHRPSVLEFFPSHFYHTAVESDDLSSIKGPITQMGSYIITFLFPDSKIKLPEPMQVLFLKFCFVSPWLHLYYSYFFVNMVNRFPFKDRSPPFQAWAWFIFNQMMGEVGTRIKGVRLCKFCNLV